MVWSVRWVVLLLFVLIGFVPRAFAQESPGNAQTASTQASRTEMALQDAALMLVNTPVYLSSRLPSLMGTRPLGAGMELDAVDELSFGIGLRTDIYTDFDEIRHGTNATSLTIATPPTTALPVISTFVRVGLLDDVDLGVRAEFLPPVTVYHGPLETRVGHFIAGMDLRYRVLEAHDAVPELLTSVGLSWFEGRMSVPSAFGAWFNAGTSSQGLFMYRGEPRISWSLGQIQPEVRARWRLDWLHPYTAVACDLTFGEIESWFEGDIDVDVESLGAGQGFLLEDFSTAAAMDVRMVGERPTLASLRLVLGTEFDLVAGLHLVLQTDISLPFHQPLTRQGAMLEDWMGDVPGSLYQRYDDDDLILRPPVVSTALGLRYDFDFVDDDDLAPDPWERAPQLGRRGDAPKPGRGLVHTDASAQVSP